MEMSNRSNVSSGWNWQLFLAIALTFLWILGGAFYISNNVGWSGFLSQPMDILGNFLEGGFAPLAFLWLVVGYFLQQKELSRNTDAIQQQYIEMQRSSDQAELQATAIQATSDHNKRLTFMRLHDLVRESLGNVIGLLYLSSQAAEDSGTVDREQMKQMWYEMKNGDPERFAREFMVVHIAAEQDMHELFYGTEIRCRHTREFMSQYERLISLAADCDPDHLILDAVNSQVNGRLYQLMCEYTDGCSPDELIRKVKP